MNFSLALPIFLWFVILFITRLINAAAPTTEAVCQNGFDWMSNTKGQSPCLVAAYLEGACGTGYWDIPALPPGNSYDGPNENQTNLCLCSTVVYTAVSACGACQGDAWITWPAWKVECDNTMITIANYKFDIPPGTAVPRWMYQDPSQQIGVTFNNTLAASVASQGQPDVTSSNQVQSSGTTSGAASTSTSSASAAGGSASKNSVNIGAIAGGVVGGLGFLTALAVIGWVCLRRRRSTRSSQAPSKQYIAKWSKEVPAGQAQSRWGGTSYGSDSVMGDMQKERDLMMSPTSTLPTNYYAGHDAAHLPYAPNGGGKPSFDSGHRNRSMETVQPQQQQPVAYYPSSPPSSYPAKKSRSHKKDHSGGSSFSRKLMGIPSTADNITPFFLPPVETTVTNPNEPPSSADLTMSPRSEGRSSFSYSVEQTAAAASSNRSPAKPSGGRKHKKTPVLAEPLPSTIEYFQNRPPPLPNNSANNVSTAARTSTEGNRSRTSFTGSRAGYYNPEDPSTYPSAGQYGTGRAPSSRRPSSDQPPTPAAAAAAWPDAAAEKAALAGRDYTPQTNIGTPGHSAYGGSAASPYYPYGISSPPVPSTSPFYASTTRAVESPGPNQPLAGASLGLTNSVHTIQSYDEDDGADVEGRGQNAGYHAVPSTLQHQRQTSAGLEGSGGFFSAFGRRVRPGGRSNESNNPSVSSPTGPTHPGRQFSIHVRNSQVGQDDFNPYQDRS